MKRIDIVGLNTERKRLIEYLQRCGVVDISDSKEGILKSRETEQSISRFDAYLAATDNAIEILSAYSTKKGGMFYKRPTIGGGEHVISEGEIGKAMARVNEVVRTRHEIDKIKDEIAAARAQRNALEPYLNLDVPMKLAKTERTLIRIGTLEGEWSAERVWQHLQEQEVADAYVEILCSGKTQSGVWILYPEWERQKAEAAFAQMKLTPVSLSLNSTPREEWERLKTKISSLQQESEQLWAQLKEFSTQLDDMKLFYDRLTVRRDKYKSLANIGVSKNAFFVTGYLPENVAEPLCKKLEEYFTVSAQISEPASDEDIPKAFSNNGFSSPVEGITSDYSMPGVGDIDPNPIMAVFYYFFFGMMFSDAGYGMIMMIACGLLGFGNLLEERKRRAYKMFFFCGVSTTIWGILYGSFFGDMIATVSNTFGSGRLALVPLLLDPVKKPLNVLIMSVAFGLVHIVTALGIKFYMTARDGKLRDAVFDTGFWIVLLLGIAVLAAGAGLGYAPVRTAGTVMMIVGAAGLVLTQGRDKKNPIMKLFGGILSLYDITSYVGDLLSYSRLMALGLATGVIASVVNVLGSLGGNSVVGLISFIVISIFGHSLNFAINMLGAYVHTNRLQYVEFYQKFYSGGGRHYRPLGFNTKYYEFKG